MNNQLLGFVLSVQEYKEHDALIKLLSSDVGLVNVVLPGYYKANSKQSRLGLEFSKVNYIVNYKENKLNRIIGGNLVDGFFEQRSDFDWLVDISILSELVGKLYHDDYKTDIFEWFEKIIVAENRTKLLCKIVYNFTGIHGVTPSLSGCSICGSKAINSFSINEAGFLCPIHSRNKGDKQELAFLYSLNLNKDINFDEEVYENGLELLIKYISYYVDINIHSWKLKTRV